MAVLRGVQTALISQFTGTTTTVTLPRAVDRSKAFVIVQPYYYVSGTTTQSTSPAVMSFRASIATNGTSITITRASTGMMVDLQWYVVDFVSGVTVQHQQASLSTTSTVTSQTETISAVDTTKSFIITSQSTNSTSYGGKQFVRTRFASSTSIELKWGVGGSSTDLFELQTVTFDGARVSYYTGTIASTATNSADITVTPSFNVNKVWCIPSWYFTSHTAANLGQKAVTAYPISGTQIRLTRDATGNAIEFGCFVVEFTDDTTAKRWNQAITGTTASVTVTHTDRDLSKSIPVSMGWNHHWGRSTYTTAAYPSVFAILMEPLADGTGYIQWRNSGASATTNFNNNLLTFSTTEPSISVNVNARIETQTLSAVSNRLTNTLWSADSHPILSDVGVVQTSYADIAAVTQPQDLGAVEANLDVPIGAVVQEQYIPEFDFAAWVYGVVQEIVLGDVTFSTGLSVSVDGVTQGQTFGAITATMPTMIAVGGVQQTHTLAALKTAAETNGVTQSITIGAVSNRLSTVVGYTEAIAVFGAIGVTQVPYLNIGAVSQPITLSGVLISTSSAVGAVSSSPIMGGVSVRQSVAIEAVSQSITLGSLTTGYSRDVSSVVQSITLAPVTNLNTTAVGGVSQGQTFGGLRTAAEVNAIVQSVVLGELGRLIPIDVPVGAITQEQTLGQVSVQLNNQVAISSVVQNVTLGQVGSRVSVSVTAHTQTIGISSVGYALGVHIGGVTQGQAFGFVSTGTGIPIAGVSQSQNLGRLSTAAEINGIAQGQTFGAISIRLASSTLISGVSQPQTFAPIGNHLSAITLGYVINYTLSAFTLAVEMQGVIQTQALEKFILAIEVDGYNKAPELGAIDERERWAVKGGVWRARVTTGKPDIIVGGMKVKVSRNAQTRKADIGTGRQYVNPLFNQDG